MLIMKHFPLLQVICFVVTLVAATTFTQTYGNVVKVDVANNNVKTTVAPAAVVAGAKTVTHGPASVAPVHHAAGTGSVSPITTVAPATGASPKVHLVPSSAAPTVAPKVQAKGTTVVPPAAAPVPVASTTRPATPAASSVVAAVHTTAVPAAAGHPIAGTVVPVAAKPAQKLTQYFEPICAQIDKLQPRHMFKIQSQLKQFIEKTAGKMSMCFMQHYAIDPNLSPVSKSQLHTICASRTTDQALKNSFKQFSDCSANNWDTKLDQELDRINVARINCAKKHDHSKYDTTMNLAHDDDDLILINDVVNKVLGESHGKADIKLINLNSNKPPTVATVADTTAHTTAAGAAAASAVAAAGSKSTLTTATPALVASSTHAPAVIKGTTHAPPAVIKASSHAPAVTKAGATHAPAVVKASTHAPQVAAGSTQVPVVAKTADKVTTQVPVSRNMKLLNEPNTMIVFVDDHKGKATTVAPKHAPQTTLAAALAKASVAPAAVAVADVKTTTKPAALAKLVAASVTTPVPVAAVPTVAAAKTSTVSPGTIISKSTVVVTVPPHAGTTVAPASATKVSAGSTTKKLDAAVTADAAKKTTTTGPKKDSEAQKAIKSLQIQRAQSHGGPSDLRMHQIEHERQMAIDPVGHTLKHKQYELSKQKKAEAVADKKP